MLMRGALMIGRRASAVSATHFFTLFFILNRCFYFFVIVVVLTVLCKQILFQFIIIFLFQENLNILPTLHYGLQNNML